MLQNSVYSKIVLNATAANALRQNIRNNKTNEGLIEMLLVTERQFEKWKLSWEKGAATSSTTTKGW